MSVSCRRIAISILLSGLVIHSAAHALTAAPPMEKTISFCISGFKKIFRKRPPDIEPSPMVESVDAKPVVAVSKPKAASESVRVPLPEPMKIEIRDVPSRYLSKIFPTGKNPIEMSEIIGARRAAWKQANPKSPNDFPMPEFQRSISDIRKKIEAISTPASERETAEYLLKEIAKLEERGYPYHDSLQVVYKATVLFHSKYQVPFSSDEIKELRKMLPKNFKSAALDKLRDGELTDLGEAMKRNGLVTEVLKDYQTFLKTAEGDAFIKRLQQSDYHEAQYLLKFRDRTLDEMRNDPENALALVNTLNAYVRGTKLRVSRELIESARENFYSSFGSTYFPTTTDLSIEAIAEAYLADFELLGITAKAMRADGTWMGSAKFLEHDQSHKRTSEMAKAIFSLPREVRAKMIAEINSVSDSQSSAMLSLIFNITHEAFFASGKSELTGSNVSREGIARMAIRLIGTKGFHTPTHDFSEQEAEQAVLWLRDHLLKNEAPR